MHVAALVWARDCADAEVGTPGAGVLGWSVGRLVGWFGTSGGNFRWRARTHTTPRAQAHRTHVAARVKALTAAWKTGWSSRFSITGRYIDTWHSHGGCPGGAWSNRAAARRASRDARATARVSTCGVNTGQTAGEWTSTLNLHPPRACKRDPSRCSVVVATPRSVGWSRWQQAILTSARRQRRIDHRGARRNIARFEIQHA